MRIETLSIPDIRLITPKVLQDERGFFSETWSAKSFDVAGIHAKFVQDNHSSSVSRGTIRGLHFQSTPHAQGKLVRVTRGAILDVAVDIRRDSPTFGQHVSVILSAANWSQLWVPVGFAHGFCTLEPNCEVVYKVTDDYAPNCDLGLAWDDPELAIGWPVERHQAILSEKDRRHPVLAELDTYFTYIDKSVK